MAIDEPNAAMALCDRGTIDGQAYWPGDPELLWQQLVTTREHELARYASVIHLRTPSSDRGYHHANPARTEDAALAGEIDRRIERAWAGHPRRFFIDCQLDFLAKLRLAIARIRDELPECCRQSPTATAGPGRG
jgi:AAA domain